MNKQAKDLEINQMILKERKRVTFCPGTSLAWEVGCLWGVLSYEWRVVSGEWWAGICEQCEWKHFNVDLQ